MRRGEDAALCRREDAPVKRRKARKLWGGFTEGKLDMIVVDTGWGGFGTGSNAGMPAVFQSRAEALARYEDVRAVTVKMAAAGRPRG